MHLLAASFVFALISLSALVSADERPAIIRWAKNHAPPFYINDGSATGGGFADGVQALLTQELPQYEHHDVVMSLSRLNDFWAKKAPYCFASMIHKPLDRTSNYLLSQPNVLYQPHVIITRRSFEKGENASVISLQQLLREDSLVFGQINSRAFGKTVDALLEPHRNSPRHFVRNDRDGVEGLLRMLIRERIDYFIDYAFVYKFYHEQAPFKQQVQFLTVAETANEGILGAIGCTNSAWGKKVMVDIDHAIERLLSSPRYRDYVSRWQAVNINKADYWRAFEAQTADIIQAGNRPTP